MSGVTVFAVGAITLTIPSLRVASRNDRPCTIFNLHSQSVHQFLVDNLARPRSQRDHATSFVEENRLDGQSGPKGQADTGKIRIRCQQPFENEENGWRRHVAQLLQHA